MQRYKKIIVTLLFLLTIQNHLIAEHNVETKLTYDPRVLGVIFMGVAIGGIGLTFLTKGCIRMINGREKNEVNAQETAFDKFIAETFARIVGAETTLVGLITAASGLAAIIGSKEIIFKCEQVMNQYQ